VAGTERALGPALGKVAILIAVAGFFLVGMAGTVYLSLRSPEVQVPEVTGKNIIEAEDMLADAGLNARRRATRYSAEVGPDTVLDQTPRAGEMVKAGQTIAVVVSRAEAKEGESSVGVRKGDQVRKETQDTPENQTANESASASNRNANGNENQNRPKRSKNTNKNGNANNRNENGNASANRNISSNLNANLTANTRNADESNNSQRNTNTRANNVNLNSDSRNAPPAPNANAATGNRTTNGNANANRSKNTNNRNTNSSGNRNARPTATPTRNSNTARP